MELKYFFAKGIATFIKRLANLLNNGPKNLPNWVISDIWPLESFMSVDKLLLNVFLNFFLCLVVNKYSWGRFFPSNICKIILRVVSVFFFWQQFPVFSIVYLIIYHLLYRIQPFLLFTELVVPLGNCSIVSFDCSRM